MRHLGDMLQTCNFLLNNGLDEFLHVDDRMALILSAVCASYGHPGLTNDFLVKTRHSRAVLYNDAAVMQNYSLSQC